MRIIIFIVVIVVGYIAYKYYQNSISNGVKAPVNVPPTLTPIQIAAAAGLNVVNSVNSTINTVADLSKGATTPAPSGGGNTNVTGVATHP